MRVKPLVYTICVTLGMSIAVFGYEPSIMCSELDPEAVDYSFKEVFDEGAESLAGVPELDGIPADISRIPNLPQYKYVKLKRTWVHDKLLQLPDYSNYEWVGSVYANYAAAGIVTINRHRYLLLFVSSTSDDREMGYLLSLDAGKPYRYPPAIKIYERKTRDPYLKIDSTYNVNYKVVGHGDNAMIRVTERGLSNQFNVPCIMESFYKITPLLQCVRRVPDCGKPIDGINSISDFPLLKTFPNNYSELNKQKYVQISEAFVFENLLQLPNVPGLTFPGKKLWRFNAYGRVNYNGMEYLIFEVFDVHSKQRCVYLSLYEGKKYPQLIVIYNNMTYMRAQTVPGLTLGCKFEVIRENSEIKYLKVSDTRVNWVNLPVQIERYYTLGSGISKEAQVVNFFR